MKNRTLFTLFILCVLKVSAQEVLSTQGNSYSNTQGSVEYTIGEVIINTASNGSNDLTQGFHQTNWKFLGMEDLAPNLDVSIFPNPTSDLLNIRTKEYKNLFYLLYDSQGNLVSNGELKGEQTVFQVDHLNAGAYFLSVRNETESLKTFQLIKLD